LLGSPFTFPKFGKSGLEISEVWSKLGQHADDMAIINSMFAEIPDHGIQQKCLIQGLHSFLSQVLVAGWYMVLVH